MYSVFIITNKKKFVLATYNDFGTVANRDLSR